jgi:hypothetical protein
MTCSLFEHSENQIKGMIHQRFDDWCDMNPLVNNILTSFYLHLLNVFSDLLGLFLRISIGSHVLKWACDFPGNQINQRECQTFINIYSKNLQENLSSHSRTEIIRPRLIGNKRPPPTYDRAQKTDKNQKDRQICMPTLE